MWDLFKGESLRFRGWTATLAGVHLAVLAFLTRVVDLAQQPLSVHTMFGVLYALLGLLLGLYQMGSYRKPSQWLNLLHRPVPRMRLATALVAAGVLQLALAVALPMLLVAAWQETMTARVVDLRHWMLPLSALLLACCGYFAGCFSSLRGPRYALAVLALPVWLAWSNAYGFAMLAVELIALAWLAWLLLDAFRPDLSAPPRGAGCFAVALPMQMGLYLLMLMAFLAFELLWIAQGSHPDKAATAPSGGYNEIARMDPRDRMLAAFDGSNHPDAALLREQVRLSQPRTIARLLPLLPQRNELANFRPMEFEDEMHGERWVFSHDDMRFHGYSLRDGHAGPALGMGTPGTAFPTPVSTAGNLPGFAGNDRMLVGSDTLYKYISETQQVLPRLRVPAGEVLVGASAVGQAIGVISDRALYFYDLRPVVEDHALLVPRLRVPMPGRIAELRNLELVELVDGYLIALAYSGRWHGAVGAAPQQVVLRTQDDGSTETIHRRALRFDYPAWFRYRNRWLSPALYTVSDTAWNLFAPALPLDATDPAPIPRSIWWLAAMLLLLSLATAVWRTARTTLSSSARLAWIAACGVIGLPALASLWLMVPPRERLAPVPALRAATV
jgi:hypothetical protein